MSGIELFTAPLAQAIGWALLHLLWQAAIVAGILAAALALLSRHSANVRYGASCSALMLVFVLFVATAWRAYEPAPPPVAPTGAASESMIPLENVPVVLAAAAAESWRDRIAPLVAGARRSLPLVVAVWLAGVVLLSSRLLVSWMRARGVARRAASDAAPEWQRIAARLGEALRLRRAVRLVESAAVEVPSVIGVLRPVILLPASALTGMTVEQIEMVLAHELAHIRRHDFFVNLLQAVVETLMFYHPAVWWMSRRVRIERENCCDDLAVAVCGDPIRYARALARLEELRGHAPVVTVAANGGSLLDRVRRIATRRPESTSATARWTAAAAMLSIIVIALALPSLPVFAHRIAPPAPPAPPPPSVAPAAPAAPATPATGEIHVAAPPAPSAPAAPAPDAFIDFDVDLDPDQDVDPELDVDHDPDIGIDVDPDFDLDLDVDIGPSISEAVRGAVMAVAPRANVNTRGRASRAPEAPSSSRQIGTAGKLTIDELIELRAVGATPEYIREMRALFPTLTFREVVNLRAVGVNASYVRDIRSAFPDAALRNIIDLKALGVTSAYVREIRTVFPSATASTISELKALGVTTAYVREIRTVFPEATARNIAELKALGVRPEYVNEMRAAGVPIRTVNEAQELKALGVSTGWVKRIAEAGYANLSIRQLINLAAAGVDADFIREMSKYRDND